MQIGIVFNYQAEFYKICHLREVYVVKLRFCVLGARALGT